MNVSLRKPKDLKYLSTILFSFFLIASVTVYASTNGTDTKNTKEKTEINPDKKKDPKQQDDKVQKKEEKKEEPKQFKPQKDSTSNSLNKLNFVFYFIYKYKYSSPGETIKNLFK